MEELTVKAEQLTRTQATKGIKLSYIIYLIRMSPLSPAKKSSRKPKETRTTEPETAFEYDKNTAGAKLLMENLKVQKGEDVIAKYNETGDNSQACDSLLWGWYISDVKEGTRAPLTEVVALSTLQSANGTSKYLKLHWSDSGEEKELEFENMKVSLGLTEGDCSIPQEIMAQVSSSEIFKSSKWREKYNNT